MAPRCLGAINVGRPVDVNDLRGLRVQALTDGGRAGEMPASQYLNSASVPSGAAGAPDAPLQPAVTTQGTASPGAMRSHAERHLPMQSSVPSNSCSPSRMRQLYTGVPGPWDVTYTSKVRLKEFGSATRGEAEVDFNTSKVRLKGTFRRTRNSRDLHFNTSKVRLKAAPSDIAQFREMQFQYLKGAIKSVYEARESLRR